MNKKLQVFVSSTYTDLIDERQAAVQAILDAGHIPAGMELFKAGNETQLKTIYRWIDHSDVYMLILGGRYGTVEDKSGKSYTHLEYEYALSKNIPVFSVVLTNSYLSNKSATLEEKNVIEQFEPTKYNDFKKLVMSKIVREVDDVKDIQIAIHATLNELIETYDLIGWIRGDSTTTNIATLLPSNITSIEHGSILMLEDSQVPICPSCWYTSHRIAPLVRINAHKYVCSTCRSYIKLSILEKWKAFWKTFLMMSIRDN